MSVAATLSRVYALGKSAPQLSKGCWIAPNAAVVGNVIMKADSSVWFGVTIRGDNEEPITIGERSNIQDNSVLHADPG